LTQSLLSNDHTGVLSIPAAGHSTHNELLSNFIQRDVTCSVIHLSSSKLQPQSAFGYLPDADMLRFLCRQTGGVFVEYDTIRTPTTPLPSPFKEQKTSSTSTPASAIVSSSLSSLPPMPTTPMTPTGGSTLLYANGQQSPHPSNPLAMSVLTIPLSVNPTSSPLPSPIGNGSSTTTSLSAPLSPPTSIMMALQFALLVRFSSLSRRPLTSALVVPHTVSSIPSLTRRESSQQLPQLSRRRDGTLIGTRSSPSSLFASTMSGGMDGELFGYNDGPSKAREKVKQYRLAVDVLRLLECRVKDGFKDGRVSVTTSTSISTPRRLLLTLVMEWQPDITVEYVVAIPFAAPPLPPPVPTPLTSMMEALAPSSSSSSSSAANRQASPEVEVEIHIIGSSDFLTRLWWYKQWLREAKQPKINTNDTSTSAPSFAAMMAGGSDGSVGSARLWAQLTDIENTDVVLYHLSMIRIPPEALLPGGRAAAISTRHAPTDVHYTMKHGDDDNDNGDESKREEEEQYLVWPSHLGGPPELSSPVLPSSLSMSRQDSNASVNGSNNGDSPVYLSSDWYLWRKMASTQNSTVWRRWFHVDSFDVICSLHHQHQETHEVDDELEVDPISNDDLPSGDHDQYDSHTNVPHFHDGLFHASTDLRGMPSTITPLGSDSPNASTTAGRNPTTQPMILLTLSNALAAWSSIPLSKQLFIRFLPSDSAAVSASSTTASSPPSSSSAPFHSLLPSALTTSSPFCAVRLTWTSAFLTSVQLAFFAVSPVGRAAVLAEVKALIAALQLTDLTYPPSPTEAAATSNNAEPSPSPQSSTNDDDVDTNTNQTNNEENGIDHKATHVTINETKSPPSSTPRTAGARLRSHSDDDIASVRDNDTTPSRPLLFQPGLSPLASASSTRPHIASSRAMVALNEQHRQQSYQPMHVRPFGFLHKPVVGMLLRTSLWPTATLTAPGMTKLQLDDLRKASLRLLRSYMRHHQWTWRVAHAHTIETSLSLLRRARAAEGFALVACNAKSSTWLRELPLLQPHTLPTSAGGQPLACVVQYSITRVGTEYIQTELWMEPFSGTYAPVITPGSPLSPSDPDMDYDEGVKEQQQRAVSALTLFNWLCAWLHSCDLHLLSAVSTFDTIREIEVRLPSSDGLLPAPPLALMASPITTLSSSPTTTATGGSGTTHSASHTTTSSSTPALARMTSMIPRVQTFDELSSHRPPQHPPAGPSSRAGSGPPSRMHDSASTSVLSSTAGSGGMARTHTSDDLSSLRGPGILASPVPAGGSSLSIDPHQLLLPQLPLQLYSDFHCDARFDYGGDSKERSFARSIAFNTTRFASSRADSSLGSATGWNPNSSMPSLKDAYLPFPSPAVHRSSFRHEALLTDSQRSKLGMDQSHHHGHHHQDILDGASPLLGASPMPNEPPPFLSLGSLGTSVDTKGGQASLLLGSSIGSTGSQTGVPLLVPEGKLVRPTVSITTPTGSVASGSGGKETKSSMSRVASVKRLALQASDRERERREEKDRRNIEVPLSITYLLECATSSAVCFASPYVADPQMKPPSLLGINLSYTGGPILESPRTPGTPLPPTVSLVHMGAPLTGSAVGIEVLPPLLRSVSDPLAPTGSTTSNDGKSLTGSQGSTESGAKSRRRRMLGADDEASQFEAERLKKEREDKAKREAAAVKSPGQRSSERMHDMLVHAIRRLADVELVEGRCFGHIISEYVIAFIVLPRRPGTLAPLPDKLKRATSNPSAAQQQYFSKYTHSDDIHDYLDQLLFAHHSRSLPSRNPMPHGHSTTSSAHLTPQPLQLPVCSDTRGLHRGSSPHICTLVFECLRDDINHPRVRLTEGMSGHPNDGYLLSDGRRMISGGGDISAAGAGASSESNEEPSRSQLIITDLLSRPPLIWSTTPAAATAAVTAAAEAKRQLEKQAQDNDIDDVMVHDITDNDEVQVTSEQTSKMNGDDHEPEPSPLSSTMTPTPRNVTTKKCTTPFGERSSNPDIEPLTHVHTTAASRSVTIHPLTHEFHARVLKAHTRNFVRGLYLNLVENVPLSIDDLHRAIHSCVEYADVVDVSYIQTPVRGGFEPAATDRHRFATKFVAIIAKHFRPIEGTSYFYYAPPAPQLPQSAQLASPAQSSPPLHKQPSDGRSPVPGGAAATPSKETKVHLPVSETKAPHHQHTHSSGGSATSATPLHDDDPELVGFMRSFPIPFFLRLEAVLQVKSFSDDGRSNIETVNVPVTNSTSLVDIWHAGVTQTSAYQGGGNGSAGAGSVPSRTTSSTSPAFPSTQRTFSMSDAASRSRTTSASGSYVDERSRKISAPIAISGMSPALGPNVTNTPPIGPDGTAARDSHSPGLPPAMNLGTIQRRKIKVWLRLACITLRPYAESEPKSDEDNDSSHHQAFSPSTNIAGSPTLKNPKPLRHLVNLPSALRTPMAELRTQVTALVAEEAVRRLQRFAVIKADHIRWFKSQLPLLPSSSLQRFAIPLHFVDVEKERARLLFPDMFLKWKEITFRCVKMEEGIVYHIQRIPYLPPAAVATASGPIGSPTINVPPLHTRDPLSPAFSSPHATLSTVSSPPLPSSSIPTPTAAREWREGTDDNGIPFWLTLVFRYDICHVCFHKSLVSLDEQQRIKQMVEKAVVDTVRLVNQTCLLATLNASRVCSSLMIPMTEEDQAAMDPSTVTTPVTYHSSHGSQYPFVPGHFACPRRESLTLPVHERVAPAVALSNLVTLALLPFAVTNRVHVYVYQEKSGAVFYMRLSDKKMEPPKPSTPSLGSPLEGKTGEAVARAIVSSDHRASPVTSPIGSPSASPPPGSAEAACLYLDVYGVEYPTDEISVEFHKMLQNKLATVTLSLLSQLLHRNPLFRLTPADHRFIRPAASAPAKAMVYPLTWSLSVAGEKSRRAPMVSQLLSMSTAQAGALTNGSSMDLQAPDLPHVTSSSALNEDVELSLDVLDPFLFLLYLKQNVQQYLPGLNLAATDRRELKGDDEKLADETRKAATAALPNDARLRAEMRPSDFFFIYNNYSAPSTSSIKKEIGKGMATVYCSLIDADGFGPISAVETSVRQPWNAHRQHHHIHIHKQRVTKYAQDAAMAAMVAPTASSVPFLSSMPPGFAQYQPTMERKGGPVFDATPPGVPATPRLGPRPVASPPPQPTNLLARIPAEELEPIAGGVSSLGENDPASDRTELSRKGFNLYDHLSRSKTPTIGLTRPSASAIDDQPQRSGGSNTSNNSNKKRWSGTGSGRGGWCLVIEIWSLGSVSNEALADRLTTSINQTFHEYLLETLLHHRRYEQSLAAAAAAAAQAEGQSGTPSPSTSFGNLQRLPGSSSPLSSAGPSTVNLTSLGSSNALSTIPSSNSLSSIGSMLSLPSIGSTGSLSSMEGAPLTEFARQGLVPCLDLLSSALAIDTQSVQRLQTQLPLAKWSMDTLLTQLQAIVSSLNPALQPLTLASARQPTMTGRFSDRHRRGLSVKTNVDDDDDILPYVVYQPNDTGMTGHDAITSSVSHRYRNGVTRRPRANYTLIAGFGATLYEPVDVKDSRLRALAEEKLKRTAATPTNDNKEKKTNENDDEAKRRRALSIGSRSKASSRKPKDEEIDAAEADEAELKGFSAGGRMLHGHLKYIADGPLMTPTVALHSTNISSGAKRSAASGLVSVPLAVAAQHAANVQLLYRNCALVVTIADRTLTVWTYNWRRGLVDQLSDHIYRLLSWNMFRQHLLSGVLHQKMGLFVHCSASSPNVPALQRNQFDDSDEVPVGGSGGSTSSVTATPALQPINASSQGRAPSMAPSGPGHPSGLPHNRFARGRGLHPGIHRGGGPGGITPTGRGMPSASSSRGLDMSNLPRSPKPLRALSGGSTPATTPTARDASNLPALSLDGTTPIEGETKEERDESSTVTASSNVPVKGQFTVENIEVLIDNPSPPTSVPSSILASLGSPLLRPLSISSSRATPTHASSSVSTPSSSSVSSVTPTSTVGSVAAAASSSRSGRPPVAPIPSTSGGSGAPPGRSGPVDFSALQARRAARARQIAAGGGSAPDNLATSPPSKTSTSAATALATMASPTHPVINTVFSPSNAISSSSSSILSPPQQSQPQHPISMVLNNLSTSLKQRPFGKLLRGLYASWDWTRHAQLHRLPSSLRGRSHRKWSHTDASSPLSPLLVPNNMLEGYDTRMDPVQRHATHLKLILAEEEQAIARRVREHDTYAKWQQLVARAPTVGGSSITILPEVIKAARVIQVSRAPLLFNDLTKSLFVERGTSGTGSTRREFPTISPRSGDVTVRDHEDAILYLNFLEGFIKDYVKYLEAILLLKVVATDSSEAPPIKQALTSSIEPLAGAMPVIGATSTTTPKPKVETIVTPGSPLKPAGSSLVSAPPPVLSGRPTRPQDVPGAATRIPGSPAGAATTTTTGGGSGVGTSHSPATIGVGSGETKLEIRSASPAKVRHVSTQEGSPAHSHATTPSSSSIHPRASPVRVPTAPLPQVSTVSTPTGAMTPSSVSTPSDLSRQNTPTTSIAAIGGQLDIGTQRSVARDSSLVAMKPCKVFMHKLVKGFTMLVQLRFQVAIFSFYLLELLSV
jgi:hypothetical protein